jgi:peptidoglycan hydrolase-like protein with peptidoglycan-binding domain
LLNTIFTIFSTSYGHLSALTPPGSYKDVQTDFDSVISAGVEQKAETIKRILSKISQAIDPEFKDKGLGKMWVDAGNTSADSYMVLIEQFKDDKDKAEAVNSFVNRKITKYLQDLKSSNAEHRITESVHFDSLYENWFPGKKGNVSNLIRQGIVVDALLKGEKDNKDISAEVQKLQSELDSILANLAKLSKSRDARKDVDEEGLDKIGERLTEMGVELNKKKADKMKSSKSYGEASRIAMKGLSLLNSAVTKENEIKSSLPKKDGKDGKSEPIKLETTISYDKANSGKVNPEVMKVQQLMYDKFKDDGKVKNTDLFKKFASFFKDGKPDGKFGPSTAGLVRALRAGFELEKNSNISQKFIDELTAHEMVKESYTAKYLSPFMLEAFDYEAYNKEAGSVAASSGSGSGSGSGSRVVPVKDWGWESEDKKENWISDKDDRSKYKGKTLQNDSKKSDKDIKNFQTLALDYIKKIGGKDKVKDLLPQGFQAGNDEDRFNKFLDSKPDGLFGLNTMSAVRFIRALLHQKIQKDPDFLGKVKEFGLGSNGFIHNNTDNQRAYNINWPLANALEKALS